MSTFNPGVNGTLQSDNLPAALLELMFKVQEAEENILVEPVPEQINITYDSNAKTASINIDLPVIRSVTANGDISETVDLTYLGNVPFAPGGGTLKSTTLADALLELVQTVVIAKNDYAALNPDLANIQRTGLDIDANALTASITTSITFTEAVVNGKPTFTAVDYLV